MIGDGSIYIVYCKSEFHEDDVEEGIFCLPSAVRLRSQEEDPILSL